MPNQTPETPADDRNDHRDLPRLVLRRKETALALRISERKLSELTADRSSGIPFVRIGTRIVFPVDELRQWLAEQVAKGARR